MEDKKSKIYGVIGSAISMLLILLLLIFVYIDSPYTPEEEGIMVSFGDADMGGGTFTEQPQQQSNKPQTAPPTKQQEVSDNDLMTQDDESLALAKQKKEEEAKKKAEEAERLKKEKEEKARLEAERKAQEAALAEQRRKEQEAIDKANQLGSLFGQSSNAQGSGGSEGSNQQKGNPAGQGTSGGNSWSLAGRSLTGKLATPAYNGNQEGIVTVAIRVNAAGKVISATVGTPTTISDKETQRAAVAAAQQAVFSSGTGDAIGTITYNFRLK